MLKVSLPAGAQHRPSDKNFVHSEIQSMFECSILFLDKSDASLHVRAVLSCSGERQLYAKPLDLFSSRLLGYSALVVTPDGVADKIARLEL